MAERATVVVTGASGNLGRAVAARLARDGANLVLIARGQDGLDAAFPELSGSRMKIAVDLVDGQATKDALDTAERHFGAIDGLCALAGGFHMGETVHETPPDTWRRMHDLNVATLLNAARAVVPGMIRRGRGRIVTVGAGAGLKGAPKMGAYCAAKSTVMRVSESMAAELAAHGLAVNCILPAIIDTPENREAMPKADPEKWTAPADIADTVAFLLSEESRAINGALLAVSASGAPHQS